jgi:predicted transcriptional regulator
LNEQGPLWRLALDELVEAGYAERQNDALYELTKRGFEKATLISATADEAQENDQKG